jgi:hypothetical protein
LIVDKGRVRDTSFMSPKHICCFLLCFGHYDRCPSARPCRNRNAATLRGRIAAHCCSDTRFREASVWRRPVLTVRMLIIGVILTLPMRAQEKRFTQEQVSNMGDNRKARKSTARTINLDASTEVPSKRWRGLPIMAMKVKDGPTRRLARRVGER